MVIIWITREASFAIPSFRPQMTAQSLPQRSHIPQQHHHPLPTASQQQQMSTAQQPQQPLLSHQQQEHYGQQFPPSRVPQSLPHPQQIGRVQGSGNQKPSSLAIVQPSTPQLGPHSRTASAEASESGNRILSKRSIHELVNQIDPSEKLDPEVEDILVDIAEDFVESEGFEAKQNKKSALLVGTQEFQVMLEGKGIILPDSKREATGAYGPVCKRDREDFWDELGSIRGLRSDPWRRYEEGIISLQIEKIWLEEEVQRLDEEKSREVWLKEGDDNTRFFHRMVNTHNRRNGCPCWKCGYWHTEENVLKDSVVGRFETSIQKKGGASSIDGLTFMGLDSNEVRGWSSFFGRRGVCSSLRSRFVKSMNATFLVLAPKKEDAKDLKDFRSISLVGSLYKLLAKGAQYRGLALELGCKVGGLPSCYLGMPLGSPFKSVVMGVDGLLFSRVFNDWESLYSILELEDSPLFPSGSFWRASVPPKITTFGCSLAKHRKSPTLEAKDILLHLERNWNMTLPGFGGDEIKTFKKPFVSDIHKERLAAIKKSAVGTESANTKSSSGQGAGNTKGHPAKTSANVLSSPNLKIREAA
ncbi:Transcription initiation factor TFIID subunit 12 [Vitis vinifera]|uniref:Transcription initiation factor TFIID subunit 12 n=1 Tax=Vitis vinifera TaxID=29760 RepID=A0A438EJY9_VITVI|nr:Transcription initiation factor TFIID subunit 12 [Vitis vinifera]